MKLLRFSNDLSHRHLPCRVLVRFLFTQPTAVVAVVTRETVFVANVGDSRAVLGKGGKTVPLTEDHKPSLPEERKRILNAGFYTIEDRVNGQLAMSRSIGEPISASFFLVPPLFSFSLTPSNAVRRSTRPLLMSPFAPRPPRSPPLLHHV